MAQLIVDVAAHIVVTLEIAACKHNTLGREELRKMLDETPGTL